MARDAESAAVADAGTPPRARERSLFTRLRLRHATEESTAAGLYGMIVSAAVMAASHAPSAVAVIGSVLVTLTVYWAAERYARLVAERIHAGHRPTWRQIRRQLTAGWAMVAASALPLAVLALARLLGMDLDHGVFLALSCSTLLLCLAGWEVGRHGKLSLGERLVSTAVAGAFGAGLIVLEVALH
jgi:hypothetical protein